jgi:hypothetical protein
MMVEPFLMLFVRDCGENFKRVLEFYQMPAKGLSKL